MFEVIVVGVQCLVKRACDRIRGWLGFQQPCLNIEHDPSKFEGGMTRLVIRQNPIHAWVMPGGNRVAPDHCERFVAGPFGVVLPDVVGFTSGLIDDVGRWNGNVGESLLDELGGVQGRIGPACRLVAVVLPDGNALPVNLLDAIAPPFSFGVVRAEIEALLFSVFANSDVWAIIASRIGFQGRSSSCHLALLRSDYGQIAKVILP